MVTSFVVGDTWSYTGTVDMRDANGNPVNLTGFTIRSQLLDSSYKVLDTFTVEWVNVATGVFKHTCNTTSKWIPGDRLFNLVFVSSNGDTVSTDVHIVKVLPRATR